MRTDFPFCSQKSISKASPGENWFPRQFPVQAIVKFLAKYYGLILTALGTIVLVLETMEHMHWIDDGIAFYAGEVFLYLLLLVAAGFLIRMFLFTQPQMDLTAGQEEFLENISADLSSSVNAAIEKKAREEDRLIQKINNVQLEIAHDLHDTIGQNISYLRMKLDQLSETNLQTNPDSKEEIKRMFAVANESYDLIRGTLAMLQSGSSADLHELFSQHAELVAERSLFKVEIATHGKPKSLPNTMLRQLFYIFREALSNIEKHANASQVYVDLTWKEDNLALVISDDGRGFDPAHVPSGSHYGLKFMRKRTEQLCGSLSVISAIRAGTKIVVRVPC